MKTMEKVDYMLEIKVEKVTESLWVSQRAYIM